MFRFNIQKPTRSYTITMPKKTQKIILPTWFSKLDMGDYSYINDKADIRSYRSPKTITIGKYCSIGECVLMAGDSDHNVRYASTFPFREFFMSHNAPENKNIKHPPRIGNDIWIGDHACIFGGIDIGDGAVVAAYAVVTKSVPAYAIVAGNPAKVVKYRFSPEIIERLSNNAWWNLPHDYICRELAPVMDDVEEFLRRAESIDPPPTSS